MASWTAGKQAGCQSLLVNNDNFMANYKLLSAHMEKKNIYETNVVDKQFLQKAGLKIVSV